MINMKWKNSSVHLFVTAEKPEKLWPIHHILQPYFEIKVTGIGSKYAFVQYLRCIEFIYSTDEEQKCICL